MCCIFTCFGWLIDVVQRCWTFTMSCCISSAVCCALITASMSGVALGYNYSLAEYIELKETNVSVFLKRGVFDDEVVDELDWRRSGGGAAAKSEEQSVPPPDSSWRRSDSIFDVSSTEKMDEIFVVEDRNKYEGSLMKLTAKPTVMEALVTFDPYPEPTIGKKANRNYPKDAAVVDTLEDMKAVQSLLNRRKMNEGISAQNQAYQGVGYMSGNEKMSDLETIQNVLNQRKQAAKRYPTQRPTKIINYRPDARTYEFTTTKPSDKPLDKPSDTLPDKPPDDVASGRRMMENDPKDQDFSDVMSLVRQQENQVAPKWWQPKPPTAKPPGGEDWPLRVITTPRPGPLTPKNVQHMSTQTAYLDSPAPPRGLIKNNRRMEYDVELGGLEDITLPGEIMPKMRKVIDNLPFSDREYIEQSWKELKPKDYSDDDIKGIPIRKKRSISSVLTTHESSYESSTTNIDYYNKNKEEGGQGLLNKILEVIRIVNSVFSFAEAVKSDISKANVSAIPGIIPNNNFSNVTTTGILIAKIIKSTIVS